MAPFDLLLKAVLFALSLMPRVLDSLGTMSPRRSLGLLHTYPSR